MEKKNVFVIGLNDFQKEAMMKGHGAERIEFHKLVDFDHIRNEEEIPLDRFREEAEKQLDAFEGRIDAIVNFWDFPASTLHPVLCEKYGLRSPSLESVLKCEHKYWSRLEQEAVIPEAIPRFTTVDPFTEDPVGDLSIPYPFWLKPARSFKSFLGFRIDDEREFREALEKIRNNIDRISEPFDELLKEAELPEEIRQLGAHVCVAEEIISGHQCTVEGYEYDGEVVAYGVVDSIREANFSSFSRYQYPSSLPEDVVERMKELSERFIKRIAYRSAPFNIEFFYEEEYDQLRLLEVNTRISKSHAPLFELVHGSSHHEVMLDLALGDRPRFPRESGEQKIAAKFMVREHEDGEVLSVPDEKKVRELEQRYPGSSIHLHVEEGMQLSELPDQDSYTYEVAVIFLSGRDEEELMERHDELIAELGLLFKRESGPVVLEEKEAIKTINPDQNDD